MIGAVWIEIPVKDFDRALKFYQAVFELKPTEITDDGVRKTTTLFGGDAAGRAGISLNKTENFEPSDKGVYAYFDAGEDLTDHLKRIESAGGKVVLPKTSMGPAGWFASCQDTEGNIFGLYSVK
jgi:uncharacterized protein